MASEAHPFRAHESFFAEFRKVLPIEFVRNIADTFFENARRTQALMVMPTMMFGFLQVLDEFEEIQAEVVRRTWGGSFEEYVKNLKENRSAWDPSKVPDLSEKIRKRFEEALEAPVFGPVLRDSTEVLRSSAVISCWSAFEFLATDLWVTAVNTFPLPLAQCALTTVDQGDSEVSGKQISVGLAARYGFDLRASMGNILKAKFEFTNLEGLRKAYRVFRNEKDFDEDFQKLFSEKKLCELEATRHLLVHRAGRVDEEYKRRTGSNLTLGTLVSFTDASAWEYFVSVQRAGTMLIACMNDWAVRMHNKQLKQGRQDAT